jgi:hypothetical protein
MHRHRGLVGHRVDEVDVVEARLAQRAGQVGDPGGRPVAGDLGATGLIVGVNEYNTHNQQYPGKSVK